ncbi:MAG: phage tail tape measure protein [Firmicutes bacterium]|nr:phage tail tape measure protein [Bacillota bacterium]
MSTFMDFAIGLSLVNGISGQISQIVGDFKRLDGVTDEVMKQLSQFKNISITGGLLAGAGIKGLQATLDVLDICVDKAAELQSTSLNLEIKAFGTDLLEQTNLPQIKAEMEELENKAMDISLNTVFNQNEIEQSMISMVKGGMSREMIEGYGAEANANFAQINGVKATSTADATVKFAAGFQLEENQIKDSLDLITKYADASISDALAIQQNIGNTTGSAMSVWKNRDNMQIAEETIQLVAATRYTAQDEASAATYVRNFLDQAGKTTFTDPQVAMMEKAGWLLEDGKSIFIDYHTGMLKSAAELEKILEDTAESMDAVDFNNLVDAFFGDRGKKTAQALAQKGGATDLAVLKLGANKQLGIDEQVARQMETAAAQMGILNEAIDTLKATVGKPFLEPIAKILKVINPQLAVFAKYLKQHPEVVKFMTAIAAGASAFLVLAGGIMLAIGLVGSFKLIWAKAGAQIVAHFAPILSMFGVVTAVIAGIAGLAFVVYRHWGTFQPKFASIWENIKQILASAKQSFINFANSVKPIISAILEVLEVLAFAVALVVLPVINAALMILAGILNGNVVQAFQNAWNSMGIFSQILFIGVSALLIYKGVILAVSIATKIWTVVQGVLNIVLAANPVGLVVLAIASLIAAVIVIIMYFKEFTEWVQKGWDKLKNFLGFKREHKDELEAPIETEISQTESIEKQVTVTTNRTSYIQEDMNGMELTPEILLNPEYQMNVAENQKKIQSIMEAMSFSFVGKGFGDMKQKISEQFADVKTSVEQNFDFANMNYTMPDVTGDLQEVTNMMQTGGTDAGNAFADALSGTGGNVQSAIQSINSIIESTLLNKEQMYLWGSNLMQSFINGMNSQKVNLMTTAAALAVTIGDYLKVQSPSRKGELKTNHLWGGNLIKSFAEGMKKEQRLLKNTTAILAEQTGGLQNSIRMENWNSEGIGRYHRKTEKREEKETEQRPIYIVIQGAEKRENEIAQEVARELDKRGYGKKKREKSPSLTMSPYKILGGY